MVDGTPVRDATPYDGNVTNGYETGSFDGYVLTVTVNDGKITLVAAADSLAPKLNFVEISGPNPAALDQATIDRVTAAGVQATHDTARPKSKTPPLIKRSIWSGGYVDDLASYTVKKPRHAAVRYFAHSNHLYSVAAVTNGSASVVERYRYGSYGYQQVLNAVGMTVLKATAVGNPFGFTGLYKDKETQRDGLLFARNRYMSTSMGRWIGRDPYHLQVAGPAMLDGYMDGLNLYAAYMVPNGVDPSGEIDIVAPGVSVAPNIENGETNYLGNGNDTQNTPNPGSVGDNYFGPNGYENVGSHHSIGGAILSLGRLSWWDSVRRGNEIAEMLGSSKDCDHFIVGHSQGVRNSLAGVYRYALKHCPQDCDCEIVTIRMVLLSPKVMAGYVSGVVEKVKAECPKIDLKILVVSSGEDWLIPRPGLLPFPGNYSGVGGPGNPGPNISNIQVHHIGTVGHSFSDTEEAARAEITQFLSGCKK